MKYRLAFIIALVLISSCSNKKSFEGYWFGRLENENYNYPILIQIKDNQFIDYYSDLHDTLYYKYFSNRFYFEDKYDRKYSFNIKLIGGKLYYKIPGDDSIYFKLEPIQNNNILLDFLNDPDFNIELPSVEGKYPQSLYPSRSFFYNLLFWGFKNDSLTLKLNENEYQLDDSLFYHFLEYKLNFKKYDNLKHHISIIADKNIKMSDYNFLEKHLRLSGFLKVAYILDFPKEYEKERYFTRRLFPPTDEELSDLKIHVDSTRLEVYVHPPLPPRLEDDFINSHLLKIDIINDKFYHKHNEIESQELSNLVKDYYTKDSLLIITYDINDESHYSSFISFYDITTNSILDLREEYSLKKYKKELKDLIWDQERDIEARFPNRITNIKY